MNLYSHFLVIRNDQKQDQSIYVVLHINCANACTCISGGTRHETHRVSSRIEQSRVSSQTFSETPDILERLMLWNGIMAKPAERVTIEAENEAVVLAK